jgi:hypothetical protein
MKEFAKRLKKAAENVRLLIGFGLQLSMLMLWQMRDLPQGMYR